MRKRTVVRREGASPPSDSLYRRTGSGHAPASRPPRAADRPGSGYAGSRDWDFSGSGARNAPRVHRPVRPARPVLHIYVLLVSLATAVLSWFPCSFLYGALAQRNEMPRCVLIGLLFFILFLPLLSVAAVYGSAAAAPVHAGRTASPAHSAGRPLYVLLFSLAGFAAALVFQFLYGSGFSFRVTEPTAFVFAIDDSGSMEYNDPRQTRYQAVHDILDGEDDSFPFMIYSFADSVDLLRDMAPKSDGVPSLSGSSIGGTALMHALETVIDDYEAGKWQGGSAPKVVMLTDGFPTDFTGEDELTGVLTRYVKKGIVVSTVGLENADKALMERIAQSTGGVFIRADSVSTLREAMRTASFGLARRDLVSTRYVLSGFAGNMALGALRIVFLSLLGLLLSFGAVKIYGGAESDFQQSVWLSSIPAFVGALEMELLTSLFHVPYLLAWFFLWPLLSVLIVWEYRALTFNNPRSGAPTPFDSKNMNLSDGRPRPGSRSTPESAVDEWFR